MIDVSRRLFIGGAISLIAVSTFTPALSTNISKIYGDGKNDDTEGFGSLFRNEPVIFSKDQIGIDNHKGIILHKGNFVMTNTIHIPKNTNIKLELVNLLIFDGSKLDNGFPFFMCYDDSGTQFENVMLVFQTNNKHKSKLINIHPEYFKNYDDDFSEQKRINWL